MLLLHKTALVTGGARGIGRAIVERFVAEGAKVAFTYVSESSTALAEAFCAQLAAQYENAKVIAFQSDAANAQAAETLVNKVLEAYGTIDILVNNAGIARDNLLLRLNETQWDDVLNTNLKSVFLLTKQVIKPMLRQKCGSIVNIGSIIGQRGNAGQANYAASKAGMIGFSKSVAQELGSRNIRCNVLSPGFIETDMTAQLPAEVQTEYSKGIPLRRFGKPEEVAATAAFLASDMSSYVSGQVISVCGGMGV